MKRGRSGWIVLSATVLLVAWGLASGAPAEDLLRPAVMVRLADHEQLALEIDIFAAKPGDFPDSQPQCVHQGKNEVIGLSPVGILRAIRQRGR